MTDRSVPPVLAEVPLVLVHVVVAMSFVRLYGDNPFLGPLLALVLGAHALAIGSRRIRLAVPAVMVLALASCVLLPTWVFFPQTTWWGLPTEATVDAAVRALDDAQAAYPKVIAPTVPLVGFQLVAGMALWAAVWFADWTAYRLRATAEALVPAVAIFVFCSILGSGEYEVASAAAFAASVLLFVAVQRAVSLASRQPTTEGGRLAAASVLRGAAGVTAVAVLLGAALAPLLPGAGADAALDWRNDGSGPGSRVTVSPMVQLRKRLVNQSDVEVFQVRSSEPAYWRLTALDRFDGEIWTSSGEYQTAEEVLPTQNSNPSARRIITQQVSIAALNSLWAPTAHEAATLVDSDAPLRWDPTSSTLIVAGSKSTSDGLSYRVVSQAPEFDPEVLERSEGSDPPEISARNLDLPELPNAATSLAEQVTRGLDNRYLMARALQDWFRSDFTYSLEGASGHSGDALTEFLESREGYCEQFAGAYAAMARHLGIPARVAVGFTPGDPDPEDPSLYRVSGRHAHAWPEVYFSGIGWVPFEPTPGRGSPGDLAHTGVPAQQDDSQGVATPPEATTTSTEPDQDPATPATVPAPETQRATTSGGPDTGSGQSGGPGLVGVFALAALAAGASLATWWWRRRQRAQDFAALSGPDQAWTTTAAAVARATGSSQGPSETPQEYAARIGEDAATVGPDLQELAWLVTASRWSAEPLDPSQLQQIDHRVQAVHAALDQLVSGEAQARSVSSSTPS